MGTRHPVARTARRITYKIQTHDVKPYLFRDIIDRTRHAVTHAGGQLLGGVYAPPKHIKRWCVLRSPHVNKKSREHFWMVTHRRVFKWDATPQVDPNAPLTISRLLPSTVAVRTCIELPGLMTLRNVFDTLQQANAPPPPPQPNSHSTSSPKHENIAQQSQTPSSNPAPISPDS